MLEFNVTVECPFCGDNLETHVNYDHHGYPVEQLDECFNCESKVKITPPILSVEGWDCDVQKYEEGEYYKKEMKDEQID